MPWGRMPCRMWGRTAFGDAAQRTVQRPKRAVRVSGLASRARTGQLEIAASLFLASCAVSR